MAREREGEREKIKTCFKYLPRFTTGVAKGQFIMCPFLGAIGIGIVNVNIINGFVENSVN